MKALEGADELRRLVLAKWMCATVWEDSNNYRRRFRCPQCGGDAFERFNSIRADDDSYEVWTVDWMSCCGYVFDGLCSLDLHTEFIEVKDPYGLVAGLIDPSFPPPWRRYEPLNQSPQIPNEKAPSAYFEILWHALHAPLDECRLFAAIQSSTTY